MKFLGRNGSVLTLEIDFADMFWVISMLFDHCMRVETDKKSFSLARELSNIMTEAIFHRDSVVTVTDVDDEKK